MHLAGRAVHHVGDLWMKLEPRRISSCSLHRGAIRTMPPGCPGRPPRITTPRHRVKGRVPSGLGQLAGRLRRAAPADTPQALHAFHPRAHVHGVDFGLVERARIWIAASWRARIQMATHSSSPSRVDYSRFRSAAPPSLSSGRPSGANSSRKPRAKLSASLKFCAACHGHQP